MGGMKYPEQPYFVGEKMIDEMGKFPYDISIDEPIPGKAGFEERMFLKKSDAETHCGNGDKARYEPVKDNDEKRQFIIIYFESSVERSSYQFYQQQERD